MYEKLAHVAQTWGLALFIIAFVLVLIYTFNHAKRKKFDEAKRIPLEDGDDDNG